MVASKSLFTSNRERRLWFWALAVVVAIWSTLASFSAAHRAASNYQRTNFAT